MNDRLSSRLVGAALLVPLAVAWLYALVLPTVRLAVMSMRDVRFRSEREAEWVGLDNYQAVLDQGDFPISILFGVSLAILPLLVFFLIGPVLGWLASLAGTGARRIVRLALVLPLAGFAPAAVGFAWMMRDAPANLPDPTAGSSNVRVAILIGFFGIVGALAFTVYAAVFRPADRTRWAAALTVSVVAALAGIAFGVQQFGLARLLSGGQRDSQTPENVMLSAAFVQARPGVGGAMLIIEFVLLAGLGLLAAAAILLSGLRIRVLPRDAVQREVNPGAKVALLAGGAVVLALALWFLVPWLGQLGNDTRDFGEAGNVGVNTWLPPLMTTVGALPLAVLGGFGIGALRPLGRFSELLLLPFAPWLFIGSGPYTVTTFDAERAAGGLNSFSALIPPLWVLIPALFVFTLLFRGQADTYTKEPGAFVRTYVVPALPAVAITGVVLWLVQAQDFLWSLVFATDPQYFTGPALFFRSVVANGFRGGFDQLPVAALTPLWLIPLVVIGAGVTQWFYADRVAITTKP